ncbi:MAG: hypothetical protein Q7T96_18040 [Methylobacter sp.]|nr:hypothetical protein [Methylobacter sp.]
MDYGTCATQSANEEITAKENRRKLTIKNPSRKIVRKIQVDGCLPITGKRCDYMFEIMGNPTSDKICKVIYVEFKGGHTEEAYKQLIATIDLFIVEHRDCKKECYIVASSVPRARTARQKLITEMSKKKKTELIFKSDQAVITI